ncbi:hypothetical protein SPBR_03217 [Sporothrix brasiliensis 5110]|uniref:Fun14 family protein n=1 Tax=Sporothrix brasiliensis 5110 TaxID=1398154 RepID=A0A0C2IUW0_9PEZI|nr:uncharacterized protein SPBR_03217 [Sporothrix brasiliensis 5110]KIH92946.1 hypothetical protein SPBR_03217 [Sporothrix brasiliensis 5110]
MRSPTSAAAWCRPAMLAGSAFQKGLASPLRLGVGLQSALLLRSRPVLPSRSLSVATVSPYTRSNNDHGRSHNGYASSSSQSSRIWYLAAAALPFTVASDSPAPTSASSWSSSNGAHGLPINAEVVSEVSKGSVIGFLIGLFVSTFSRTLVLLLGAGITFQSLAARAGIDLVKYLQLKERFKSSRILASLAEHTAFKLAFGITFAMSAFMYI